MTALAVLRKQRLMTQRELAAAAGVTTATLSYTESGLTRPKIVTIRKICRVLSVQPRVVDEFRLRFPTQVVGPEDFVFELPDIREVLPARCSRDNPRVSR
jgi:transcriptional regulator with XRE-family HTH domain